MARQGNLFGEDPDPPRHKRGDPPGPAPVPEHLQQVAAQLSSRVHLGTSSWSFPGWEGLVYDRRVPETRLAKEGLAAYARHPLLRTVGVDRTYYKPVEADLFRDFARQVPEDFRFLVKALEACVMARFPKHPRYGARKGEDNPLFLDVGHARDVVVAPFVEGLGPKGGPLLFQFPPQDLKAVGGPEAWLDRLQAFLEALPKGPLYAVELRNRELLVPRYAELLAEVGAVHTYSLHTSMPDLNRQTEVVDPSTQASLVVRWMLGSGLQYDQARRRYEPFDQLVDEDPLTRDDVAGLVLDAAGLVLDAGTVQQRSAFVVVNNKAEGSSPLSVFRLAERMTQRMAGGDPASRI